MLPLFLLKKLPDMILLLLLALSPCEDELMLVAELDDVAELDREKIELDPSLDAMSELAPSSNAGGDSDALLLLLSLLPVALAAKAAR